MWKMPMKDSSLIRNRGITRLSIFVCHTRKCMIEASHLFRVIALDRTNMISVGFMWQLLLNLFLDGFYEGHPQILGESVLHRVRNVLPAEIKLVDKYIHFKSLFFSPEIDREASGLYNATNREFWKIFFSELDQVKVRCCMKDRADFEHLRAF